MFVAVQLVTGLGALLFSNLDKLGTGYPIDQLTVSPMATGISMLVGEGLLALGQDDAPASWWSITIRVVVALLLVAGALMPLHRMGKAAQAAA